MFLSNRCRVNSAGGGNHPTYVLNFLGTLDILGILAHLFSYFPLSHSFQPGEGKLQEGKIVGFQCILVN